MLKSKIVYLKKIYKFGFDYFLEKRTVFILIKKNVKNKKPWFPAKLCEIRKNVNKQNCSFQKDLQILFLPFFDKTHGFCFNREKCYYKIKNSIFWTNSATYETNVKEQNCSF